MAELSPVRQSGAAAAATGGTRPAGSGDAASAGGPARGGGINSLGQTARDAAWNGLQSMGLSGARLQAVWVPLTQDVRADHYGPEASLSNDEQSRVRSLVNAAVGSSQGSGSSNSGGASGTSENSGGTSGSGTSSGTSGSSSSGGTSGSSGTSGSGSSGTSGSGNSAPGVTAPDARTGTPSGMPGSLYRAADPTTLGAQKAVIVDALHARGASDDDIRSVMAMAMVESESMVLSQRQSEKDRDPNPDARVYSAMNINSALLKNLGVDGGAQASLNSGSDAESLRRAANVSYDGIKKYGLDGYLKQVRGGSSGIDAHGMHEYLDAVNNTRSLLASDPALLRDGRRYGQYVSPR